MNTVLDETKKTLLHGENAVVCLVADSSGSAPRKAGAAMLVRQNGKTAGSVGGGNLEVLCTKKAIEVYKSGKSVTEKIQLDADAGMICGGSVTVEYKFIDSSTSIDEVSKILGVKEEKTNIYIFGAGHVGKELYQLLLHSDFNVILSDDRKDIDADCLYCDYSNIASNINISKNDYVVVMTHGHIADQEVLLQICKINPAYIGCIGSKKKVEATAEYLRKNGISEEIIKTIHTPIGLAIGAETPYEIAVSVAAELIKKYRLNK